MIELDTSHFCMLHQIYKYYIMEWCNAWVCNVKHWLTVVGFLVLRLGEIFLHCQLRLCRLCVWWGWGLGWGLGWGFNGWWLVAGGVVLSSSQEVLERIDAPLFVLLALWQVFHSGPRDNVQSCRRENLEQKTRIFSGRIPDFCSGGGGAEMRE